MKKRLYFGIIALLVLAFSLVLGFVLDGLEDFAITNDTATVIYWVFKGLALLALVVVYIMLSVKKMDAGHYYILIRNTLLLQIAPFITRLLLMGDSAHIVWAVIFCFVVIIAYFVLLFSSDILNDRIQSVEKDLEGKSIPVVDDASFFEEDGKFKGTQKD